MKMFTNLRIGTKLAITSALSVLLIAMMIYGQMDGNAAVRKMNESAIAQQILARNAVDAKASIRGMQIGVRDLRLARLPADMQKANEYVAARQKSATRVCRRDAETFKDAENRERIEKSRPCSVTMLAARRRSRRSGTKQSASKRSVPQAVNCRLMPLPG